MTLKSLTIKFIKRGRGYQEKIFSTMSRTPEEIVYHSKLRRQIELLERDLSLEISSVGKTCLEQTRHLLLKDLLEDQLRNYKHG